MMRALLGLLPAQEGEIAWIRREVGDCVERRDDARGRRFEAVEIAGHPVFVETIAERAGQQPDVAAGERDEAGLDGLAVLRSFVGATETVRGDRQDRVKLRDRQGACGTGGAFDCDGHCF